MGWRCTCFSNEGLFLDCCPSRPEATRQDPKEPRGLRAKTRTLLRSGARELRGTPASQEHQGEPGRVAQVAGVSSRAPQGCGFGPRSGAYRRQLSDGSLTSMFLSPSPSLKSTNVCPQGRIKRKI